jgi:starch-binding outer membrane protein, SusD/RagB family
MKNQIKIISILFLIVSNSCSGDFFEKQPLGSTSETVFYNEKGINALLTGTYGIVSGGVQGEGINWGASIQNWTYGSVASDDAYKGSDFGDQPAVNEIERWEVVSTNDYSQQKWKWGLGLGVFRANEVLRIINLTSGLPPATETRLRAEALFLRGLFNFETWLVFQNIPIITEEIENPSEVSNINPEGAVLAHIINDLKFAWENLPETQIQPGRPTKFAAMALAARAYLQILDYASAKPLLDNIITSGKYELMPAFFDNYRIAHNNNKESIFEIQSSVNDAGYGSYNAEMGIGLNWPMGGDIGTCCGFHQPSQNLVNAYRVDENGLPMFENFNDNDLKHDQGITSSSIFVPFEDEIDPRLDWTVSRRGIPFLDWGINRGFEWIRDQSNGGPYLTVTKPFFYKAERHIFSTTTGWMSGNNANNYRYIRYGHILLWRAEVAAFDGDFELARTLINQVRQRAGNEVVMGRVQIYQLPSAVYPWGEEGDIDWSQPAANYNIGLYPAGAFTSKKEAMRAVQWELRLEFATEGHRFFDLRRWDNLPSDIKVAEMADILNSYAQRDTRIRTVMTGATFNERDKLQPIPQAQIDLQPGVLQQNPDY